MIHNHDVEINASQIKRGDVVCSGVMDKDDNQMTGSFTAYSDARWNAAKQCWNVDFDGAPTQWFAEDCKVWIEPRS